MRSDAWSEAKPVKVCNAIPQDQKPPLVRENEQALEIRNWNIQIVVSLH